VNTIDLCREEQQRKNKPETIIVLDEGPAVRSSYASLSRTPSPFLKPHERLAAAKAAAAASAAVPKKSRDQSQSSSSDSSAESDDSEEQPRRKKQPTNMETSKRKKHKKHKKHSKKSKKHKKHKRKCSAGKSRADSSSQGSSDEDEQLPHSVAAKRNGNAGKLALLLPGASGAGVINEDLEKQLRERALKSMKKLD